MSMDIPTALNHATALRHALLQANEGASPLLAHALYPLIGEATTLMNKLKTLDSILVEEDAHEPGSCARLTSTDTGEQGQRIAYVKEASQYGAVVFHPACDATRAVTGELGAKCVTFTHIGILKGLGYEVRTTGAQGRTL